MNAQPSKVMTLLTELIAWIRYKWNEPIDYTVPLKVRIIDLAEAWHVVSQGGWSTSMRFCTVWMPRWIGCTEAVQEIGER